MPSATSIVARSFPDHVIGVENRLPWHLRTDLKLFKKRTEGHAIIMGRKTFESLGKPLKNRVNIVVSRTPVEDYDNVKWAVDPSTALLLADAYSIYFRKREFFIIGGENIYELFFNIINEVWLTEVFCGRLNGDAKFDASFDSAEWKYRSERDFPKSEGDDWPFRISWLVRRKKEHRERSKDDFLKVDVDVMARLDEWAAEIEAVERAHEQLTEAEQLALFDFA